MEKGTYSGIAAQTPSDTGLKTTMAANEAILGSVKEYGIKFSQLIEKEQQEDVRLQTIAREAVNRLAAAKADTSYSKFVSDMKDEYMGKLAEIESRRKGRAFDSKLQAEQNAVISQMNRTLSEIETSNGIAAAWSEGLKDYDPDLGKSQVLLADEFNEKMMKGIFVYRNGGVYDTEKQQQLGSVSDVMAQYHQPLPKNTDWLNKTINAAKNVLTQATSEEDVELVGGKIVSRQKTGFSTESRRNAESAIRQLWGVDDKNGLSQEGRAAIKRFMVDTAGIRSVAEMKAPNDIISMEDIQMAREIVADKTLLTGPVTEKIKSLAAAYMANSVIPSTDKKGAEIATRSQLGGDGDSGDKNDNAAITNARALYMEFLNSTEGAALDPEELSKRTNIKEPKIQFSWVKKAKIKLSDGTYKTDWVPSNESDPGAVRGVRIDGRTGYAEQLAAGDVRIKDAKTTMFLPKTDPGIMAAFVSSYSPKKEKQGETAIALKNIRDIQGPSSQEFKRYVDKNGFITRAEKINTKGVATKLKVEPAYRGNERVGSIITDETGKKVIIFKDGTQQPYNPGR